MGLDMYLTATKYVGGWNHSPPNDRADYDKLREATGLTPCSDSQSFHVEATVGYWRKANAIHKWFVENVQDGVDECQRSYVEREQLEGLRAACRQVLDSIETVEGQIHTGTTYHPDGRVVKNMKPGVVVAQPGLAESVLPTQSGFFFGSTDYDEYYIDDLKRTVEIIDRVLSDESLKDCDFHYRASW